MFLAFSDEFEKLASSYYERNRQRVLAKGARYRRENKVQLQRKAKIYRAKVRSGRKRPRRRVTMGHSYSFIRR